MARLALSFDAWKDGCVSPAVVEAPIAVPLADDSKEIRATLRGHTDEVTGLAFTSDGATLVSLSAKEGVRLWDTVSAKERARLKSIGPPYSLTIAPDGALVAGSWYEPFDKDGRTLNPPYPADAVKGYRGDAKWWDVKSGKERGSLRPSPSHCISGIALSPDGKNLAVDESWVESDGKQMQFQNALILWDVIAGKVRGKIAEPNASALAFAPDGKTLAIGNDKGVILWDVTTGRQLGKLDTAKTWPRILAYSPDGKNLAAIFYRKKTVTIWDVAGGKVKARLEPGEFLSPASLAFSPDSATLAVGEGPNDSRIVEPGVIVLWDVAAAKKRLTLRGHVGNVLAVAFSADGKLLASGGRDKTIKLWNIASLAASKR